MRLTRPALLLLLLGCLLMFFALGNHHLQGSTESRVAGIAMQMHVSQDWVTPSLLNEPFLEKPPLSLWLDATAIGVSGGSLFAVRLASAIAGLCCIMLLFTQLRRFGRSTAMAWTAAAMLATMGSFWGNARQVGEDSLLTLGVTMTLLAFYQASRQPRLTLSSGLLFVSGITIATLTKGVFGLALPGVVIFTFLLCQSLINKRLVVRDWLRPALLTLLGLIPLVLWLCVLYQHGGVQAVSEVLLRNSIGRFSGSFVEAGHYEPFYYYLRKLPESFLPWNLLTFLGLWHFRKQLRHNPYLLFFCVWLLAQYLLLNLASSKRAVYLMALTPAAAVIAAEYAGVVLQWLRTNSQQSVIAKFFSDYHRALAIALLAGVVTTYVIAAAVWAPRADHSESFQPVAAHVISLQAHGKSVALLQPDERLGAVVFYSQQLQHTLNSAAELQAFLAASPNHIAVTNTTDVPGVALTVQDTVSVGRHHFYFVTLAPTPKN